MVIFSCFTVFTEFFEILDQKFGFLVKKYVDIGRTEIKIFGEKNFFRAKMMIFWKFFGLKIEKMTQKIIIFALKKFISPKN